MNTNIPWLLRFLWLGQKLLDTSHKCIATTDNIHSHQTNIDLEEASGGVGEIRLANLNSDPELALLPKS